MTPNAPEQQAAASYLSEVRFHWRALAATCAGMGAGFLLNHYVANMFAPHLIAEFGWSRAQFALLGSMAFLTAFVVPVVGRMTDLFGVRPVAAVGVVVLPLSFVACSLMDGSLLMFGAISFFQLLLAGATTSSTVYSRLIAERFVSARGLGLALAATTPAIAGVIGSPLLHNAIEAWGWRTGYLIVAAYTAVGGALCLLLIPRDGGRARQGRPKRSARVDYPAVLRAPAFWIIAGGILLCNLIFPLQSSQMKLMLMENGASSMTASWLISFFASGVLIGRFACGLALDRFPAHLVAAIALGLPALGLFSLVAGLNSLPFLAGAVVMMGLSLGAESDLLAYLTMRYFRLEVYGTALGLIVGAMAIATALGSALLGLTLKLTGNFGLYMLLAGILCCVGAGLFLLLGRESVARSALDGPLA